MTEQSTNKPGQTPQVPQPDMPTDPKSAATPDKRDEDQKGNAPQKDKPADK